MNAEVVVTGGVVSKGDDDEWMEEEGERMWSEC